MSHPLLSLNPLEIEKLHAQAGKQVHKSIKTFARMEGGDGCVAIGRAVQSQIEEFKPYIPLFLSLRCAGMRDRHWDDLTAELHVRLRPDETFTLKKVIKMKLLDHLDTIRRVAERATREDQIEQSLDKMSHAWDSVLLHIEPYRWVGFAYGCLAVVVSFEGCAVPLFLVCNPQGVGHVCVEGCR
jgi:dynein heavy chain, axonemal